MARKTQDFVAEVRQLAEQLRAQIEAEVDGFTADPAAAAQRRARAEHDYRFFAETYFPHYVKYAPAQLHLYLYQRIPEIFRARGTHDVIAAPRGEAKSTHLSMIAIVWAVLYRKRHYPLIIMDAFEQAAEMLEAIKAELQFNPRICNDFAEEAGEGRVWKVGVIVARTDVKVEVFGVGKRIRGRRHGPHRPDLVVLDDIENDENVRSAEQRDKTERWLLRTVLKLGAADDALSVVYVGTVLHYDSVLARFLRNKLWRARTFRGLPRLPDRMDLWDKWEELLLAGDDPDAAAAAARAFYDKHRRQMERGAVLSWPAARPLEKLMLIRARDGHESFDSEIQNEPVSTLDAVFAGLQFWVNRLPSWVFYGACDPSLGRRGAQRDPSAIGIGGLNRETGVLDVVEALIGKRLPDRIISDIIELQREYLCLAWAFEAVQFQEFLRAELVKRSAAAGVPVPAIAVTPNTDKDLRIESLQPHTKNGLIRFHPSQTTLLAQLRHWPKADHDDGPDMLQMLWALAVTRVPAAGVTKLDPGVRRAFERTRRTMGLMFGRTAA